MTDVLVLLLVVLPPFDWLAAMVLTSVSRRNPSVLALRERAVAAVICAVAASIAGILAWARLGFLEVERGTALFLLALTLVIASVPSLYWLVLLATGRFRIEGEG